MGASQGTLSLAAPRTPSLRRWPSGPPGLTLLAPGGEGPSEPARQVPSGAGGCAGHAAGTGTAPPAPVQRPYDIHSGNAVESLVQLFSTASVQYVPSWSKDMVALLRKVRPRECGLGPASCPEGGWRAVSVLSGSGQQPAGWPAGL